MPAAHKSRSTLRAAAAPLALSLSAVALETLTTGCPGLLSWIIGGLTTLAEGVAGNVLQSESADQEARATFLTNDQLTVFTGDVLSALTSQFAESDAAASERKPLSALAGRLPAWWLRLCREDHPATRPLSGQAFVLTVASSLTEHEPRPPLEVESLHALLDDAVGAGSGISPVMLRGLAQYIHQHLTSALSTGLTSSTPGATRAFRKCLLRLQSEAIAGVLSLTDRFDFFVSEYIQHTDGLDDALQQIISVNNDTNLRVRLIEARLKATDKERRLQAYLAALTTGFRGYTEIGIEKGKEGEDESPPIWNIFVQPSCSAERAVSPQEMEDAFPPPGSALKAKPLTTAVEPLLPLLADENNRRHVLLGDPGMGKSTLIQVLTAGIASGKFSHGALARGRCLPIPIILRDIVPHLPDDPGLWNWSTLCDTMRAHYQRSEDAPCLFCPWSDYGLLCEELFQSPLAFFLVDGLDEIGDTAKRTAIRNAIWEGFKTYPHARWLVTSRIVGYEVAAVDEVHWWEDEPAPYDEFECEYVENRERDDPPDKAIVEWGGLIIASSFQGWGSGFGSLSQRKSWHIFEVARLHYLAPFNNTQQEQFVTNWFRERKEHNHPPGLLGDIRGKEHDGIRVLARVPNLLSYMAILKRDGKPLPDGRAELYTAIARAYLHSIDKAYRLSKKHGHDCPIPFEGRLRLLSILAGEMQHRRSAAIVAREADEKKNPRRDAASGDKPSEAEGNIVIEEREVHALLLDPVRRLLPQADAEKELSDFLSFIGHRSGLLLPRGAGKDGRPLYGFTHLSFLEYFAACYLRDELEHGKDMLAAAAEEGTTPDDPAFASRYLQQYPRGPRLLQRSDLPGFAARPEWQEVLIFLAEFFHDKPRQRDPLLRALFPFLHSESEIEIRTADFDNIFLAFPDTAAALAIKLARDAHLALPEATRHAWFVRLWDAWLSWRVPAGRIHPSRVNALLLDHPTHEAPALAALRAAAALHTAGAPRHTDITFLCLDGCPGLTHASFLREIWPALQQLSLEGCTGLSAVDQLPASLTGLSLAGCTGLSAVDQLPASLSTLYLSECTALRAVDQLPASLTELSLMGCTGLSAVDQLPDSLTRLWLNGCTGLSAVDHLPASLKTLYLHGCTGLSTVDQLPASLTWVSLFGCTRLSADAVARLKVRLPRCDIYGV